MIETQQQTDISNINYVEKKDADDYVVLIVVVIPTI